MSTIFLGRHLSHKLESVLKEIHEKVPVMVYKIMLISSCFASFFWASIFLYAIFYLEYVPQRSNTWPLHFEYDTCNSNPGLCSNPKAFVEIQDNVIGSVLTRGQKYKIFVDFDMPDTPRNQELGMFTTKLRIHNGKNCYNDLRQTVYCSLHKSTRSSMLKYTSALIRSISTIVFSPLYLSGIKEEAHTLSVEMLSEVIEDAKDPFHSISVEVDSKYLHIYSATLRFEASFSGLTYFLFHYPIMAAIAGITGLMVLFSICFTISCLHNLWTSTRETVARIELPTEPNVKSICMKCENAMTTSTKLGNLSITEGDEPEISCVNTVATLTSFHTTCSSDNTTKVEEIISEKKVDDVETDDYSTDGVETLPSGDDSPEKALSTASIMKSYEYVAVMNTPNVET